jgi:signal peptidase I
VPPVLLGQARHVDNKYVRFVFWTAVIMGSLVGLGRLIAFDTWTVPDNIGIFSAPTLAAGDTVVLLRRGQPGFGDLVRCTDPEKPTDFVIGRIVGLAGDEVLVTQTGIRVNNKRYDPDTMCKDGSFRAIHPATGAELEFTCAIVNAMGGGWHYIAEDRNHRQIDKQPSKVTPGNVYLLSDNRDFHDDTRDYGQVPFSSCKERIVFRLWGKEGWGDSASRLTVIR